jgi:hypothetical protein
MRLLPGLSAVLLTAMLHVGAAAATRDQFNERDAVSIDPQRSYIFFRTHAPQALRLMREATPQDQAAWRTARSAALARAQAGYDHAVDRYRIAVRDCETRRCRDAPERPVRATDENFNFPPAEAGNFLEVSSGPVFSRDGDTFTYLIAVPPGTYAVYGTTVSFGAGLVNMCQCMGSVRFDAPAGRIVDLGVVSYSGIEGGFSITPVITPVVTPYAPDMARPARLNGLPVIPAELRAVDKIPNYLGGLINRHPPLRGVLRYEGDRVIDDRTGQAPTPRP